MLRIDPRNVVKMKNRKQCVWFGYYWIFEVFAMESQGRRSLAKSEYLII
jgi:hypothetical protein